MKKVTTMKKIFCDFCDDKEIEQSETKTKKPVSFKGKLFDVEIKLSSPGHRRFQHDICRACVLQAVELATLELPIARQEAASAFGSKV